MAPQSSVTLRCNNCGHEWKSRSTGGKARQCSKCRSRDISEVSAKETPSEGTSSIVTDNDKHVSKKSYVRVTSRSQALANDPEIREKLKELELARIERQITEERGAVHDPDVLMRIVGDFKTLLFELNDSGRLTDKQYDSLVHHCPWCTSSSMEIEEFSDSEFGWKCRYCGKTIS